MFPNKTLILLAACLGLCLSSDICANVQKSALYVGEVKGDRVNIRTGPHISHEVVHTAKKGQKLFAFEEKDGWINVSLPSSSGLWIHKKLVEKTADDQGEVLKDAVNVRLKPGTYYYIMGQLHRGDSVNILDENPEWYKISAPRFASGWVSKDYFKFFLSPAAFEKRQAAEKVQQLFGEVEQIYNREQLKSADKRNYRYLMGLYYNIVINYEQYPEAKLAQNRYDQLKDALAKDAWQELQNQWDILSKQDATEADLQALSNEYKQFTKDYQGSSYAQIAEERLNFLENRTTIGLDLNQFSEGVATYKQLTGVIHDLGVIINRPATHKLMKDGEIVCLLRSSTFNLNDYVYRKVKLKGLLMQIEGWDIPVFEVQELEKTSWKGRF